MSVRRIALLGAVFLSLFYSCQSAPVVWDSSYPEEKLATVQFYYMKINSFNGINVSNFYHVKIPAGQTALGGNVDIHYSGVTFRTKDMEFTCMFEEGKMYTVMGSAQNMLWGVNVYEDGSLLAFIPFKKQPVFTK